MKTNDLEGMQLDWAVMRALQKYQPTNGTEENDEFDRLYPYSLDWGYGGQIIEEWKISLNRTVFLHNDDWHWKATLSYMHEPSTGETALIAAMRAFVTHTFGSSLKVPSIKKLRQLCQSRKLEAFLESIGYED